VNDGITVEDLGRDGRRPIMIAYAPTHQKRLLNLLLVTYIGLFCLMTNAISFQAVLTGKGGL
jgi:hypothetical protein